MKKLFVLAVSLCGLSAYASIPIVDATATIESSGLIDVLMAAMDNETLIAALLCFFLGTLGIHWFYLGDKGKGFKRLGLFVGAYALTIMGGVIGIPALALVGSLVLLVNWVLSILDLVKILTDKI